jgi:hypothetical protein
MRNGPKSCYIVFQNMSDTDLILHIKGTEKETTILPRRAVRAAISQGRLSHSQLIWSPNDNTWKQVRELPDLWPSQKLAPAPAPRVHSGTLPKISATQTPQPRISGTAQPKARIPRVAVAGSQGQPVATATARQAAPAAAMKVQTPKTHATVKQFLQEKLEHHPVMLLCIGLSVFIVLLWIINYFLVDRPLVSALDRTDYSRVTVFAHLGAFVQPDMVVIHVPRSSSINADNLTQFLVALAKSTPSKPFSSSTYNRVALTTGWTGQYSFSGGDWQQLGEMEHEDPAQQKEFVLDQIGNVSGDPLMAADPTLDDAALAAKRDKVWSDLVSYFGEQ